MRRWRRGAGVSKVHLLCTTIILLRCWILNLTQSELLVLVVANQAAALVLVLMLIDAHEEFSARHTPTFAIDRRGRNFRQSVSESTSIGRHYTWMMVSGHQSFTTVFLG